MFASAVVDVYSGKNVRGVMNVVNTDISKSSSFACWIQSYNW